MKILYFITRSDTVGGAQIHVRDLALAMSDKKHEVLVVVGGKGIYYDMLCELGINVRSIEFLRRDISIIRDLKVINEFRKIVKSYNPDIVSLHSAKSGMIGRLALFSIRKTKVLFTAHGWSHIRTALGLKRAIYIGIEYVLQAFSERIVTVCYEDQVFAKKTLKIMNKKVITIHNAMSEIETNRVISRKMPVKFVTIARFQEPKDYYTLLKAFISLKSHDWLLEIVGDGPDFDKNYDIVKKANRLDKIIFIGRSDNVADILNKADVFLLISKSEGFPRSILEAMRSKLPVIATNVGGIKESVFDGVNGFLVATENVNELSIKINQLIIDHEMRIKMSKNSERLFFENFTFSKMFCKTMAVYEEVM